MVNKFRTLGVLSLLFAGLCTTHHVSAQSLPQVGQKVPFGQFGDPKDFPYTIVGYDKSLGTDAVTGGKSPQVYSELLNKATDNPNSGVRHYSGPSLRFELVEVSGVASGTTAMLLKSGRFVSMVPFAAGTIFEIGGEAPATAVFIVKRSAWTGKDPIVCFRLLPGQGYRLTDLPYKVSGKYKGQQNIDCSPPGDIRRYLDDARFNRVRDDAIIDRGA